MRKLVCAALVLLTLAARPARPQTSGAAGGEEFVTAEVVLGGWSKSPRIFRAPVFNGVRKFVDDKFDGAGWASVESCSEVIGCSGHILVTADYVTDDSSRVMVVLEYGDRKRCNQTKKFTVARGKTTELKMKCGAKVKAYYAPGPKAGR